MSYRPFIPHITAGDLAWTKSEIDAWAAHHGCDVAWELDRDGPGLHAISVSGACKRALDELRRNRPLMLALNITPLPEDLN